MPNEVNGITLATTGELATMLGKKYVTIVAWRNRYENFPKPAFVLNPTSTKPRPIYNADEVKTWVEQIGPAQRGFPSVLGSQILKLRDTNPEAYADIMRILEQSVIIK